MVRFLVSLLVALFFYVIIPGWGAFHVRNLWRGFRKKIIQASLTPSIDNGKFSRERLTQTSAIEKPDSFLGNFRFFGKLEAMQADIIWLKENRISVSADLKDGTVYSIPSVIKLPEDTEDKEEELPDDPPERMAWKKLFSLPEGTKIFIAGSLYADKGQIVFRGDKKDPLTVILYDGPEESLFGRVIWGGRQKNEYWNQYTPVSLSIGAFTLLILTYTYLRNPFLHMPALITLALSLIPIIILFPPGVVFYFIYKNLWKRSRVLRAKRDLVRLPAHFFGKLPEDATVRAIQSTATLPTATLPTATLPNGETYGFRIVPTATLPTATLPTATLPTATLPTATLPRATMASDAAAAKLRTCGMTMGKETEASYYLFGRPVTGPDGTPRMEKPVDPMAEHILLPGNPETLARICAEKAKTFEILAMLSFFTGLIGNSVLAFILFSLLIR